MSRAQRRQAQLIAARPKPIHPGPAIAILMPTRGSVVVETAQAITANLDGFNHILMASPRLPVMESRNKLVLGAKNNLRNAPFTPQGGWLCLWADSDSYWRPGTIARMVDILTRNNLDILAGWFCGRAPKANPVAYFEDGSWPTEFDSGSVIEVARVGFHFVLHRLELLEKMPDAPFTVTDPQITDGTGEDTAFCDNARSIGARIWVDTGSPVAHIDDEGNAYLPGEPAMVVHGGQLRKPIVERSYD